MTTTAVGRRGALVAMLAVVLLAVGLSAPALAAEAETHHFKGEFAAASWSMDDARNSHVFVGAMDGSLLGPSLLPQDRDNVYVSVTQSYCDDGEQVFRSYFGFADEGASIDAGALSEASADVETTVEGFELRSDGCDGEPPFFDPDAESNELDSYDVELSASWEATDKMDVSVRNFHFNGGDFVVNSTNVSRSRDAEATGTLTGLADAGVDSELGTSDHAQIVSVIDGYVSVQR